MSEVMMQQEGAPKRDKVRLVADDVVTANGLATHLGMTRRNVARLTAEAVLVQRSDGRYDQTASRLRYIKHLRSEHRRSPRTEADAAHLAVKTDLLQLRLMEKRRELVRREDVDEMVDRMAGTVLTHLSGMAARCSRDLATRRAIDNVVLEIRREIAAVCVAQADAWVNRRPFSRSERASVRRCAVWRMSDFGPLRHQAEPAVTGPV